MKTQQERRPALGPHYNAFSAIFQNLRWIDSHNGRLTGKNNHDWHLVDDRNHVVSCGSVQTEYINWTHTY